MNYVKPRHAMFFDTALGRMLARIGVKVAVRLDFEPFDGHYKVTSPDLAGLLVQGLSYEEALNKAAAAIPYLMSEQGVKDKLEIEILTQVSAPVGHKD